MAEQFREYRDAFNYAVEWADKRNADCGIEKVKCPFARREMFNVHFLPKPQNRYGFELRCQVVRPGEPRMAKHP